MMKPEMSLDAPGPIDSAVCIVGSAMRIIPTFCYAAKRIEQWEALWTYKEIINDARSAWLSAPLIAVTNCFDNLRPLENHWRGLDLRY
jgi:hypothetical protein